jgi:hypothetical protein
MTTYAPSTEAKLNTIMTTLGTVKASLWPFWESTGIVVSGITAGADLIPSETGGAAEALEDDFSPYELRGTFGGTGLYTYNFIPTGDHHLAGGDHTDYSHGNGTVDTAFSVGAWVRPLAVASNVIIAKYDSVGGAEEYRFWIDASGLLNLELHDASASATEIATGAAITLGQFQFVVATYDGTEATPAVHLYVDGVDGNSAGATTEAGAYVAMENTATPLTIGCGGVTATPTTEFHGRIAMPFMCGKELTAAEVVTLRDIMRPMVGIN